MTTPRGLSGNELNVLAACLAFKAEAVREAQRCISPEDFGTEAGRVLFEVLVNLATTEGAFDLPMVAEALKGRGQLDALGGDAGLTALCDAGVTDATLSYHARRVREAGDRRRLLGELNACQEEAGREDRPIREVQAAVVERITQVCTVGTGDEFFTTKRPAPIHR